MTQKDLRDEWAWIQLEAWADGSLTGESRARMDTAMAADPRLRAAAERAVAVQRALRESPSLAVPHGLRRRLLAIPSGAPRARRSHFVPALASAAAAAALVAVALWTRPEPPAPVDPRVAAAAQDFETAMRLLQRSAVVTQARVKNAVGTGVRETFVASRNALARETDENGG
jgi:hypothetical protein